MSEQALLKERLRAASRSFRKGEGRHVLKTEDVIYCAFSTPRFAVARNEAQRSAPLRLARFGLDRGIVAGRRVLDLGCHAGAMLFELKNLGIGDGLGVEYDLDKVTLARDIAAFSGISGLRFEQGDIDRLEMADMGAFDMVLALAIERHLLQPARLFAFLGRVTGELLCFEGNGGCDAGVVAAGLKDCGFRRIVHVGFCDDDIVPENNRRPMLLAYK